MPDVPHLTATLDKVQSGYLLNGRLFLSEPDYESPEAQAHIRRVAQSWAERIDDAILERVYSEVYGKA